MSLLSRLRSILRALLGSAPTGPVKLAIGSSRIHSAEFVRLLRRRLLVFSLLLTSGLTALLLLPWIIVWRDLRNGEQLDDIDVLFLTSNTLLCGAPFIVSLVNTFLLRLRRWNAEASLRKLEYLLIVALALTLGAAEWGNFYYEFDIERRWAPELRIAWGASFTHLTTLYWFALLVVYGVSVPQTLARSLLTIGALGTVPVLEFIALGIFLYPLNWTFVGLVILEIGTWMILGVVVAVSSAVRYARLKKRSIEADVYGSYRLGRELSSGGMGKVFKAFHPLMKRDCAIKVIKEKRASDPDAIEKFKKEIERTAKLTHPNNIIIYDGGESEDGTPYYAMEYLPGRSLANVIDQDGPQSPKFTIQCLRQICSAIGEAHRLGLVHRDIKPGNVMLCERGGIKDFVKVIDYGLAFLRLPGLDPSSAHKPGGTLGYMAPEQFSEDEVQDARTDIYGIGATAYCMIFARTPHPYYGLKPAEFASLERELGTLGSVIAKCLQRDPAKRYQDCEHLDSALSYCFVDPSVPVASMSKSFDFAKEIEKQWHII